MTEPTQPTPAPKDRTDGVRVSLPPDARPGTSSMPNQITRIGSQAMSPMA